MNKVDKIFAFGERNTPQSDIRFSILNVDTQEVNVEVPSCSVPDVEATLNYQSKEVMNFGR